MEDFEKFLDKTEEKTESYLNRVINWFKLNYKNISLVAIALGLGFASGAIVVDKMKKQIITEKIIYKDNPKDVVLSKNWFTEDLDQMEYQKSILTTSYKTKEEIFGVWRKYEDDKGLSYYLAIFEPIKDMKFNNKEYSKYLEDTKLEKSKSE